MLKKKIQKAGNLYKSVTKIISAKSNNELDYKYVVCKNCRYCIRLPRNKGDIVATCPMCNTTFDTHT